MNATRRSPRPNPTSFLGKRARQGFATAVQLGSALDQMRRQRAASLALTQAASQRHRPVVVGPWISEVGFEVLYWVPFVRWALRRHRVPPDRVTVITRGGAHCWYGDVAGHHVELFDHFTPEEMREWNERRVESEGGQKHMALTAFDQEILRRAGDAVDPDAELLHPSVMYNAFRYFWAGRAPTKTITRHLAYERLPPTRRTDIRARLPEEYVAVKAYHSSSFPPTPRNREFVADLVERLSRNLPVVLLSTGLRVDDHSELALDSRPDVLQAERWMVPADNLLVQTEVIRGARALVSSYGGFSYLGPFMGVPSVCFWSERNFNPSHLELMQQAVHNLEAPSFIPLDVRDFGVIDDVMRAPVVTSGVAREQAP